MFPGFHALRHCSHSRRLIPATTSPVLRQVFGFNFHHLRHEQHHPMLAHIQSCLFFTTRDTFTDPSPRTQKKKNEKERKTENRASPRYKKRERDFRYRAPNSSSRRQTHTNSDHPRQKYLHCNNHKLHHYKRRYLVGDVTSTHRRQGEFSSIRHAQRLNGIVNEDGTRYNHRLHIKSSSIRHAWQVNGFGIAINGNHARNRQKKNMKLTSIDVNSSSRADAKAKTTQKYFMNSRFTSKMTSAWRRDQASKTDDSVQIWQTTGKGNRNWLPKSTASAQPDKKQQSTTVLQVIRSLLKGDKPHESNHSGMLDMHNMQNMPNNRKNSSSQRLYKPTFTLSEISSPSKDQYQHLNAASKADHIAVSYFQMPKIKNWMDQSQIIPMSPSSTISSTSKSRSVELDRRSFVVDDYDDYRKQEEDVNEDAHKDTEAGPHVDNCADAVSLHPVNMPKQDLGSPHLLYPFARSLPRTIYYHYGPTNSGKTYSAMQHLSKASSGVYSGPLRLLAFEKFEQLNKNGVVTSLVTGQEKIDVPFAKHISSTLEAYSGTSRGCDVSLDVPILNNMGFSATVASIDHRPSDVVVLDEIQLIADPARGWAWTQALLGSPAKEIHLCGDASALNICRHIAQSCGDHFEAISYQRRSPLHMLPKSLNGNIRNLKRGDAVIVFSRDQCFSLKSYIENTLNVKCCVIYGKLPPETRAKQARLFNDPDSGYDILIATDAIGLGLNLNINRIVFMRMQKYNAELRSSQCLDLPLIKQIAGRAGRYASLYEEGFVTCFDEKSMPILQSAMSTKELPQSDRAGLFPSFEQVLSYMNKTSHVYDPDTQFANILDAFSKNSITDSRYFLCTEKFSSMKILAELVQSIPKLPLKDRFMFCETPFAPLSKDDILALFFQRFVRDYTNSQPVRLFGSHMPRELTYSGVSPQSVGAMELQYRVLSLYLQLANSFGTITFPDADFARQLRHHVTESIDYAISTPEVCLAHRYVDFSKKIRSPRRHIECKVELDELELPEQSKKTEFINQQNT